MMSVLAFVFLPLFLAPNWTLVSLNEAQVQTNVDLVKFTAIPNSSEYKTEQIQLENGRFSRAVTDYPEAILFNEIKSERDGVMLLQLGSEYPYLQVAFNGELLLDVETAANSYGLDGKGSHIVALPVRKGKNLLAVKIFMARKRVEQLSETDPAKKLQYLDFVCGEADKELYLATLPTRENFEKIAYAPDGSRRRRLEEHIIRNGIDRMTCGYFNNFDANANWSTEELEKMYADHPVLWFYDQAMSKILKEVPETKVTEGAVVWHLYNMGYIVKTPESCFGIDIHHRRATELLPLLDFVLVTHNHADHYNLPLLGQMSGAKKMDITAFFPGWGYQRTPKIVTIKDVRIEPEMTDHNKKLQKFVTPFRIICGKSDNAPIIYHTGDSCDATQLRPAGRVDIHIVHPKVGMSEPQAVKLLNPREVWFSHLMEMGHCKPNRWSPVDFSDAYCNIDAIKRLNIQGVKYRIPIWGEKIVLK